MVRIFRSHTLSRSDAEKLVWCERKWFRSWWPSCALPPSEYLVHISSLHRTQNSYVLTIHAMAAKADVLACVIMNCKFGSMFFLSTEYVFVSAASQQCLPRNEELFGMYLFQSIHQEWWQQVVCPTGIRACVWIQPGSSMSDFRVVVWELSVVAQLWTLQRVSDSLSAALRVGLHVVGYLRNAERTSRNLEIVYTIYHHTNERHNWQDEWKKRQLVNIDNIRQHTPEYWSLAFTILKLEILCRTPFVHWWKRRQTMNKSCLVL